VTPPGVAVFAVSPEPSRQVGDRETGYGRDPRYLDPAHAGEAAAEGARHFLTGWRDFAASGSGKLDGNIRPISVAQLSVHDMGHPWPTGRSGDWLDEVLVQLTRLEGAATVSLRRYLDREPAGVLGRPGPSAGGILSARPRDSDLFDRCRAAADLVTFALDQRRGYSGIERRCVAHMTRTLLRAQQVDWSLPPGHGIDAQRGLKRASDHLEQFYRLAGSLLAGRPDRRLLGDLDRGPAYLPEIDLELLCP
jgi:1,4-alpha-glucan branching enzyme